MDASLILLNDPMYKLFASGEVLWGDIEDSPVAPAVQQQQQHDYDAVPVGPAEDGFYYLDEWDLFRNWDMPDLKLRKNIWEKFPVSLIQLPETDGTDRYSVVWHEKNLREWREVRSMSMDEHDCYEEFCRARLMRALEAHSHKYRIEPATAERQICILAMVHSDATATATATATAAAERPKALGILKRWAVSWDREGKIHYIKPHMKKLRDLGVTPEEITFDLLDELGMCDDCVVSAATRKGDICTVTML